MARSKNGARQGVFCLRLFAKRKFIGCFPEEVLEQVMTK
jgi:hypothetical protein